jgi:acyl-CoA hydrolase
MTKVKERDMEGKAIKQSKNIIARMMLPQDANPSGNVHGGVIMKEIDNAAGIAAAKHSRMFCVTASIDRLDFHNPVFVGNLLIVKSSVNMVGNTSMEVGVRVEAEDILAGLVRHIASAYLTFVAMGPDFTPAKVPPLLLETEDDRRRNHEALRRKESRLALKTREKQCQMEPGACYD